MEPSSQLLSTALFAIHWVVAVSLSVRVIMRRRPVGVSLAWLAVVFSVPIGGALLYLFVGEARLGRYVPRAATIAPDYDRWRARMAHADAVAEPASGEGAAALDRQVRRTFGLPPFDGNRWRLLEDFEATFDALSVDIDAAQRSCEMQFYIWHEGGRADDIVEALIRAAGRGVTCRVLADAVGSRPFLASPGAGRLREGGVEVRATLPVGAFSFVRNNLRNHRKIAVFDGRVAYTGSQNLVDPRFFKQDAGVGEWVDAMVRLEGPVVEALQGVFRQNWAVESGRGFDAPASSASERFSDGVAIQVVPSGPGPRPDALYQALMSAVYAARRELVITTPYFVPDESLLLALVSAALRGVEVTLVVPERNDSLLVGYASVSSFDELASSGVRVALFTGGLLHTKSMTVDGEFAGFGSVNLDMRSLWLNFELSLVVYDRRFTSALRSLQQRYIDASEILDLTAWRARPARRRLAENAARLIGPLL